VTRVKICGLTSLDDALAAVAAGADALGFVMCDSPRRVTAPAVREIVDRLPPFVVTVGVFRDDSAARVEQLASTAGVDWVQLHGSEPPEEVARLRRRVIKRFTVETGDDAAVLEARMAPYAGAARLLDPGAGSGQAFDWEIARGLAGPLIVAGGLDPDNVGRAIEVARPHAVDVCSGVEQSPGKKSRERLVAFVEAVRRSDAGPRA